MRLVCQTFWKDIYSIRIRKFTVPDSRGVSITPLCRQIAHVLGNDCDAVFISLKSTENLQRVTLSC